MAALTTQVLTPTGIAPTYAAVGGSGDSFTPGDHVFLHVKNAGGSPSTVTVTTPGTVDGLAIADLTVTVPATTGDRMIGPLPARTFAKTDGQADVACSPTTSVTIAVVKVG
ncbi:hypothetical protein SAMN05216275_14167 [Streptosporangium canum]|uniref:Uncharacterized protein n=1 Tax=Streptosporangium canum TaxID=324952 RepID=A0A1I4DL80_9ACTN|nr:hypothetical protein [Streptosporangium canum]SFK92661.1 hypothetical protein SAMN05216275_14167 [Streptosporangium canum]